MREGVVVPVRPLVAVVLAGAAACLLPFAGVRLGPWQSFLPAFLTLLVVLDGITAFLLIQQYLVRGTRRLLVLAATYMLTAAVTVAHLATFPGVLAVPGLLDGQPSTTIWLWAAWHLVYPAGLVAASVPWPFRWGTLPAPDRRVVIALLGVILPVAAAATASLIVADSQNLPVLSRGDDYRNLGRLLGVPLIATSVLAVAVTSWRGRWGEPVQRWLPVAATACLADVVLVLAGGDRWSLGWYAGRLLGTIATFVVLGVLLHQVTVLYRRLWDEHERLLEESRHDFLTTLLTRREGLRRSAALLQQASRHGFPVTLGVLDVDHFKSFNDTHGHAVGDRVLEEVAARVRSSLRAGDFAFRMGGEEFGIVFSHATEEEALEGAWRILRVMRSRPVRTEDGPVTVTASVGVAGAGTDLAVEDVVERADQALYEAKRSGRDRARGHSRLLISESEA